MRGSAEIVSRPQQETPKNDRDFNRPIRFPQLLNLLSTETPEEKIDYQEVIVEKSEQEEPISFCFTKNLTCLVTVMLASLQAALLILCTGMAFFYCKRYRWRRRMEPSVDDSIQYVVIDTESETSGTYRSTK